MYPLLPAWSVLLAVLAASSAAQASGGRDELAVRSLVISEHPDEPTHRVYVKGQVVTTLRFEKNVEPGKTRMLGWEGRLEPLAVVRNKVILEPLHDLDSDEGIPLAVTLVDGTEVAFLLRPPVREQWGWPDQQVDVFEDRDSSAALRAALADARQKNGALTEENERYHKEETSEDHALAALLASGAVEQTPFTRSDAFSGVDADAAVQAMVYRGKGKVAVVFKVKNRQARGTWSVQRVRLSTLPEGDERSVAVRATSRELLPGQSGVVAVVADKSAFVNAGAWRDLLLEVYRHDGLRQAVVTLDHSLVAR